MRTIDLVNERPGPTLPGGTALPLLRACRHRREPPVSGLAVHQHLQQRIHRFQQTAIRLDVFFDPAVLHQDTLATADYPALVQAAFRTCFPEVDGRQDNGAGSTAGQQRRRLSAAQHGAEGPRAHRQDRVRLGAGRRRCGHVDQGTYPAGCARGGTPDVRQAARLDRPAGRQERVERKFNTHLFHGRRFPGARAGRHLGRRGRLLLHPGDHPGALVSHRGGRRGLPGGIRRAKTAGPT